jgi:hypothetical protein
MSRVRAGTVVCGLLGWLGLLPACEADGVGDPCVPEDEYSDTFAGFAVTEVSTESRSFQCQSRLCLVNHFQGRVSCPYGQSSEQAAGAARCSLPSGSEPVRSVVQAQLLERRADQAVYCSCRCDGPDESARYCECPSGFSCLPVVPDFELGQAQLPGSYCVKEGSRYERTLARGPLCDSALSNCGAD